MSNDICIWKSNASFAKEDAGLIYGQLAEGETKPDAIDATEAIKQLVKTISNMYPPLEQDPSSVWASSFICSDWHCMVSMSYDSENYVDAFIALQELCTEHGLTLFDSGSGDVFP